AGFRRRPRIGRQELVLGRHKAERRALEVLRLGITGLVPEVRRIEKSAEIVAERGRERGHAGAGLDENFRPSRRNDPAADDDGGALAKLEKDRQMTHRYRPRDFIRARRPAAGGRPDRRQIDFTTRDSRLSSVRIKGKRGGVLAQIWVLAGSVGPRGGAAASGGRNFEN